MTPEQVAAFAACWACVANRQAAILFLLARIAGMTPEQVAAGSSCWNCVPNFAAAELFLLNSIATNGAGGGGGGGGSVLRTSGDPEGVLVAPTAAAWAYDPVTTATYEYTGVAGGNTGWIFKS